MQVPLTSVFQRQLEGLATSEEQSVVGSQTDMSKARMGQVQEVTMAESPGCLATDKCNVGPCPQGDLLSPSISSWSCSLEP